MSVTCLTLSVQGCVSLDQHVCYLSDPACTGVCLSGWTWTPVLYQTWSLSRFRICFRCCCPIWIPRSSACSYQAAHAQESTTNQITLPVFRGHPVFTERFKDPNYFRLFGMVNWQLEKIAEMELLIFTTTLGDHVPNMRLGKCGWRDENRRSAPTLQFFFKREHWMRILWPIRWVFKAAVTLYFPISVFLCL